MISVLYNYYDFLYFLRDFKKYCGEFFLKFFIDKFYFLKEIMVDVFVILK